MSLRAGDTCNTCGRRLPHPRKPSTPKTKPFHYHAPVDEAEAHRDVLETSAKYLGVYEQPYWAFKTISLALALVLLDESLRGFGQRSAA